MQIPAQTVGPLQQVQLSLEAGTTSDAMDLTPQPMAYGFIFGLGADGLAPFERALIDRRVGEQITLRLDPHALQTTFEHLPLPGVLLPGKAADLFMRVTITAVAPADQREVIRQLARRSACGGDCGCGCGGH
ncbi:MAG: hypothetical protein MUF67_06810 [Desulfobacterales bacterium]|jgi:hypothetical protein|nr:hypothetical protein [Desulfobacterales bacterium]